MILNALLLDIDFLEIVEKVQRRFIKSGHKIFSDDELAI